MRFIIHDARRDRAAANAAFEFYVDSETDPRRLVEYADGASRRGLTERAQKALVRALEIAPDAAPTHYLLGIVYASTDPAKAKKHLETFLELAPDHPEITTAKEMLSHL